MRFFLSLIRALFAPLPLGGAFGYTPHALRPPPIGNGVQRKAAAHPDQAELRDRLSQALQHIAVLERQDAVLAREAQAATRAKDDFLATLSHELRTPLNATLGWIQLLRLHAEEPLIREHAIDVLERNARAQVQIVSDLLDLSRIVTGKMHLFREDVDAAEIVRRASESQAASAAAKNVTLQMNIAADGPRLSGDKARLEQVVWNLVNNALKFTPSGGLVTVSLDFEPSAVRIVVADNGVGIAPDKLPHVFERLRQGDSSSTRSFGGLGLGLAIVSHLVDRHGGTVRAESEGLGKGAVFTVTLPYHL